MAAVLHADTDALRAAASRWQMIGGDLGASGVPSVNLARTWPSAAATSGIHGQAAAATAAFQARIDETAAVPTNAANAYQQHETVKAGDIKDVMSLVTGPMHDVISMAGSLGSVSSSIGGTLGQLGGQSVSITTNLTSTLTSSLSHVGGAPQSLPVPTDHAFGHIVGSQSEPPSMSPPPDDQRNQLAPRSIDPMLKET
ncbi:MAG: hypothetical protein WCC28_11730 [Mycobacterium sp.]|uniref:hypothetical protein n=1 Tax=Mycobacterium sp. TaxID=1785 RepID=UPI003C718E69